MKLTVILCCLIGVIAFAVVPYESYVRSADGLLIFLGLLVAALVQVIPVTANFLQSDTLTADEAKRLVRALEAQQKYWLGLLAVAALTCISLVIGKAMNPGTLTFEFAVKEVSASVEVDRLFSAATSILLFLVLYKGAGFFPGVLSLQKLRGELAISAALRRQAEKEEEISRRVADDDKDRAIVPQDYGRLLRPQKH